jgi:hypothetical protein
VLIISLRMITTVSVLNFVLISITKIRKLLYKQLVFAYCSLSNVHT